MTYTGYLAEVTMDLEAGVLHGEVVNARSVLTFSAKAVGDLEGAFADTIEDYLAWCAERGVAPEKPYSGTLSLRISPELHRVVAVAASRCGASVNTFIMRALERVTDAAGDRLLIDQGAVWETSRSKVAFGAQYTQEHQFDAPAGWVPPKAQVRMH